MQRVHPTQLSAGKARDKIVEEFEVTIREQKVKLL